MLKIHDKITIQSWELSEQFIRASGPGGQNVNKTSSAVELRFEAERSPSLSEPVKKRLKKIAGTKWTKDGAIVLKCDETRHLNFSNRKSNKSYKEMIKKSQVTPKRRLATSPTLARNRRRLTAKKNRADLKSNRARISTKNIPLD